MPGERTTSAAELYEQIQNFRERQQRTMERAAQALQLGSELLRQSWPDTFLGRQHHAFIELPADTIRDRTKSPVG
jgi:hypothetical protein